MVDSNFKLEPIQGDSQLIERINKFTEIMKNQGITINEAANSLNKVLAASFENNNNIPYELELEKERSDFFDQTQYDLIGIDWGSDYVNN